jgi:transposase
MESRVCESCGLTWHGATLRGWKCPRCGGSFGKEGEPGPDPQAPVPPREDPEGDPVGASD